MSDLIWPPGLPRLPLREGFSHVLAKQVLATPTDRGRPLVRRKSTARLETVQNTILCSDAQKDLLEAFYYDATQGGALPFDTESPAHGGRTITVMFHPDAAPPKAVPHGAAGWSIALTDAEAGQESGCSAACPAAAYDANP